MSDTDVRRRTRHNVPCGRASFEDPEQAIRHAAGCTLCSSAIREQQAAEIGPRAGSATHRRRQVEQAQARLGAYLESIERNEGPGQVRRLADAIAALLVALDAQTNGRAGDPYSHGHKVLGQYERTQG